MTANNHKEVRNVLVTGANGFIGRALCHRLLSEGYNVSAVVRQLSKPIDRVNYLVADLERSNDLSLEGLGIDCIVHLAGRAHVLGEKNAGALELYRLANRDATVRLAQLAIAAGVMRFVYISSIGVNGSETYTGAFDERTTAHPHADYAVSKYEAELQLNAMMKTLPIESVIVRPPLVYDVQAPGNFARLLRLVSSGLPLPFAALDNKRSMISLKNLVGFIELCIRHPDAARELFLVSDGCDLSTTDIVKLLAEGMGKRPFMFPIPDSLALFGAKLIGRQNLHVQLFRSLQVDSSKARRLLGWHPEEDARAALIEVGSSWNRRYSR